MKSLYRFSVLSTFLFVLVFGCGPKWDGWFLPLIKGSDSVKEAIKRDLDDPRDAYFTEVKACFLDFDTDKNTCTVHVHGYVHSSNGLGAVKKVGFLARAVGSQTNTMKPHFPKEPVYIYYEDDHRYQQFFREDDHFLGDFFDLDTRDSTTGLRIGE